MTLAWFEEVAVHLGACLGWSREYIERELDWRLLQTVTRYLARNPPVPLLLKAFMGIETDSLPGASPPPDPETRKQQFIQAFQAAGGSLL